MDRAARTRLLDLTYRGMPTGTVVRVPKQSLTDGFHLEVYWPGAEGDTVASGGQARLHFAQGLLDEYVHASESVRLALDKRVMHVINGHCRTHMATLSSGRDVELGGVWEVRAAEPA